MDNQTYYHVTTWQNYQTIRRTGMIKPSIGPNSQQIQETIPHIYLFNSYEDACDGVANWLGEQFDANVELVCLKIKWEKPLNHVAFEAQCDENIPIVAIQQVYRQF